jgi:protein-S-isoprenylcysteine O-methyltransferase Ste14
VSPTPDAALADLAALHARLVETILILAAVTFVALLFVTAPYGRHRRDGWGPTLPSRLAWLVMEAPASLAFLGFYALGAHRLDAAPLALCALWQAHYVNRAFVYPLRMREGGQRMPVAIAALAVGWNLLNAWVNARWLSALAVYEPGWLGGPRFLAGAALFALGLAANLRADARLRALRRPGETGYAIPRGGLFELVSCPNYLGEIVEWSGFALAAWSPAAAAFALYTAANLVPRALANHRFYLERFPDYPKARRALVPVLL